MKKCLLSIINQSQIPSEIIIIDNNSPTSPRNILKTITENEKEIEVRFTKNPHNLGFAKAVNLGASQALYKFLIFLNPDVIVENNAIGNIFNLVQKKFKHKQQAVIVGGKSVSWTNRQTLPTVAKMPNFKTLLFEFTSLKKVFPHAKASNNFWDYTALNNTSISYVNMVSGNFLFIGKKLFFRLKKFDENYFMYLEDLDLCLRAKKNKISIIYYPRAIIKHFSGGSNKNKKSKIDQKSWDHSKRYFCKKWFRAKGYLLIFIFNLDDLIILIKKTLEKMVNYQ